MANGLCVFPHVSRLSSHTQIFDARHGMRDVSFVDSIFSNSALSGPLWYGVTRGLVMLDHGLLGFGPFQGRHAAYGGADG